MNRHSITVIEPNGVQRVRPLPEYGLTIGRGPDNDLPLTYDLVSRQHAWISFEGGYIYVTDLNSANGTYLGNSRLPPNEPTPWSSGVPLRIGDVQIHLGEYQPESTQPQTAEPVPYQAGGRQRRDREETSIGPAAGFSGQGAKGRNWTLIIVGVVLLLLCACAVLGAGAYLFIDFSQLTF
jgi:predicted component of type VI protein secretion system